MSKRLVKSIREAMEDKDPELFIKIIAKDAGHIARAKAKAEMYKKYTNFSNPKIIHIAHWQNPSNGGGVYAR